LRRRACGLRFGFAGIGRRFFSRRSLSRSIGANVGDDAFRGGGRKGLGDGLLATASASTAPTATTAATTTLSLAGGGRLRTRLRGRFDAGFFTDGMRFELGFLRCRGFDILGARFGGGWSLFCIEICRLQGRGRGLTSLLRGFLLAAL
jgi:hypothetical protein